MLPNKDKPADIIMCSSKHAMPRQCPIKQRESPVLSLPFTSLLLSTSRQHRARAFAPKSSKLSLIEHGPYMGGWPLHATLCAHTTILWSLKSAQTLHNPFGWQHKLSAWTCTEITRNIRVQWIRELMDYGNTRITHMSAASLLKSRK